MHDHISKLTAGQKAWSGTMGKRMRCVWRERRRRDDRYPFGGKIRATDDYQARSSACERRFETVLDLMAIACHELGADNSWRDPAPATSESALRIIQGDDGQESPGNGPRDQAVQHAGRGTPELPLRSEQTCIAHKRTD
jgi:hypothetical protein